MIYIQYSSCLECGNNCLCLWWEKSTQYLTPTSRGRVRYTVCSGITKSRVNLFSEWEHTLEFEVNVCVANCDDIRIFALCRTKINNFQIKCVVEGSFTLHHATHVCATIVKKSLRFCRIDSFRRRGLFFLLLIKCQFFSLWMCSKVRTSALALPFIHYEHSTLHE